MKIRSSQRKEVAYGIKFKGEENGYQGSGKKVSEGNQKEKGKILDEFCFLSGYTRC